MVDGKPQLLVLDRAEQFQCLALSARFAAFDELFSTQRKATATELSRRAGVSPSSMSYHLRELERHGLVRRAGQAEDGRQRLWEAPAEVYDIVASSIDDPAARTALVDAQLGPMRARMVQRLETRRRKQDNGVDSPETILATGRLCLTPDQQRALQSEVVELWRRWEQLSWQQTANSAELREVTYMWSFLESEDCYRQGEAASGTAESA